MSLRLLLLGILAIISCSKKEATTNQVIDWTDKTNVFIGDSITEGYGASSPNNRWTTLLSSDKKSVEDNQGVGGRVLQTGNTCGRNTLSFDVIPQKTTTHLFLFVALGVNDIGFNNGSARFSPEGYQLRLEQFVEAAKTKGWSASDIIIITPFYFNLE